MPSQNGSFLKNERHHTGRRQEISTRMSVFIKNCVNILTRCSQRMRTNNETFILSKPSFWWHFSWAKFLSAPSTRTWLVELLCASASCCSAVAHCSAFSGPPCSCTVTRMFFVRQKTKFAQPTYVWQYLKKVKDPVYLFFQTTLSSPVNAAKFMTEISESIIR